MTQSNPIADGGNGDDTKGNHHGYDGQVGTFLMQGGEHVAVHPVTLAPLPSVDEPAPETALPAAPDPVVEKTKPAPKSVGKPADDANKTE